MENKTDYYNKKDLIFKSIDEDKSLTKKDKLQLLSFLEYIYNKLRNKQTKADGNFKIGFICGIISALFLILICVSVSYSLSGLI